MIHNRRRTADDSFVCIIRPGLARSRYLFQTDASVRCGVSLVRDWYWIPRIERMNIWISVCALCYLYTQLVLFEW